MSITQTTETALDTVVARFEQIREDAAECIRRRDQLLLTTQAELAAAGIDAAIVRNHQKLTDGTPVRVIEEYASYARCWRRVDARRVDTPRFNDAWGPYSNTPGTVYIYHGEYEVLVADEDVALVAKVPGQDEEAGHARAIGRLRRLARAEHMRVSVRDRAVTLKSPMNDIVHEGDVNSAYVWLSGIDTTTALNDYPVSN